MGAKKGVQCLDAQDVKADFLRRLSSGETIPIAASKAGLNDPRLIHDYVGEYFQSENADLYVEAEAVTTAIATLKEICAHGEEHDKVRCDAAKALLQYVSKTRVKQEKIAIEADVHPTYGIPTIWDFSQ